MSVCATYTAEPIADYLNFWLHAVGLDWGIEFAAYRQTFQQLLDPNSMLSRNRSGYPVLLLRLEDLIAPKLLSPEPAPEIDPLAAQGRLEQLTRELQKMTDELRIAIEQFAATASRTLIVVVHLPSPEIWQGASKLVSDATLTLIERLEVVPNVICVHDGELDTYAVDLVYDAERRALGDVPFTTEAFAALATVLARRVHMLEVPTRKVLVLDCDNTLWGGIVGEDGIDGIRLDAQHTLLQRFAVEQAERGVLVVLCSKNNEADVHETFGKRTDFELKREHIVAHRINWEPKSHNIAALARELNLGLDSFVFLDDNARECAEVKAALPMVLTLQVPSCPSTLERMLNHLWAFDKPRVTSEDRKRSELYRQEAQRKDALSKATTLDDFLGTLQLQVQMDPLSGEDVERVAQLTQRTNQFNTTTIRRSETDVKTLLQGPRRCSVVRVSDRFGDYGLVGVVVHEIRRGRLWVESLMLSCRVLGRGVEYAILRQLGAMAKQAGVVDIAFRAVRSERNQPAFNFLDAALERQPESGDPGSKGMAVYAVSVAEACTAQPKSNADADMAPSSERRTAASASATRSQSGAKDVRESEEKAPDSAPRRIDGSVLGERIALQLHSAKAIVDAVAELRSRKAQSSGHVPPRDGIEARLAQIWERTLHLRELGATDDFFQIGGTSILAVSVLAQVQREFGVALPLSTLLEAPTVRALADVLTQKTHDRSIVPLRAGNTSQPAFFFIHDGLGETLLYANVARRLPRGIRAFGIEPKRALGVPMADLSIEAMAARYVSLLRAEQPRGPYFLGGLCAGGVIALETARQLQAQGEPVELVVLFDSAAPKARRRAGATKERRLQSARENWTGLLSGQGASERTRSVVALGKKVVRATHYEVTSRLRRHTDRALHNLLAVFLRQDLHWPNWLPQWSVQDLFNLAEERYVLQPGEYASNVLLVRANSGDGADTPHRMRYADEDLGWGPLLGDSLRIVDVAAGHSSMLQEPQVAELASVLRSFLTPTDSSRNGRTSEERASNEPVSNGPSDDESVPADRREQRGQHLRALDELAS